MTDQIIRRFQIAGTVADDSLFPQLRVTYYNNIVTMMKDQDYVPLLDINPVWKTQYNGNSYDCIYTWHGVYVGERAWEYAGVTDQKLILMHRSK